MKPINSVDAPLISIAMCTYNGERYLREQLDSLITQDYPNLEIQIVDDCSTDATFQILTEYSAKYPQVLIHQNERNLGFRRNFEKALSLCSGEYISLCDQDDIWFPQKVSALYNAIGDNQLAYAEVQLIDDDGTELDKGFPPVNVLDDPSHMSLLLTNCVTGHACLIRRSLLEKALPIPDDVKMHDHWLAFVAASTGGIKLLHEKLSFYRQHVSNAVLHTSKRKRFDNAKRRFSMYQERIGFVNAVSAADWLPSDDRKLICELREALLKYPFCFRNRKLHKMLLENSDLLLAIYKDPGKGLQKLTRGYLYDLFFSIS